MIAPGVNEEAVTFQGRQDALSGTPFEGPARFRTFGSAGPMYEVLSVGDREIRIFLFNSGEEAHYRLDRALSDPRGGVVFAIAFDLTVATTEALHPRGQQQAYADIERLLRSQGFRRVQGSVYVSDGEDLAELMTAMESLRGLPWFPASVRDIRAFRVEQWSDFTSYMKRERP